MKLIKYIKELLDEREKNGFKHIYFMIDVHNTIIKPSHSKNENFIFFDYAKEVLQELSKRKDVKLIMWTSTYPLVVEMYLKKFEEIGIHFDFVNSNKDMVNDDIRCFDNKFFYDVCIDDKCGFDAERDWEKIWFIVLNSGKK